MRLGIESVLKELERCGHRIERNIQDGGCDQRILIDPTTGFLLGTTEALRYGCAGSD